MKLKKWILTRNINSLVFILLSPMLLCLLVLPGIGQSSSSGILAILSVCILIQLSIYIIYTNLLGSIVIDHSRQPGFSMKPIISTSISSIAALLWLSTSMITGLTHMSYAFLILTVSELIRAYFISRIFIISEKQSLSFWNYLTNIWILLNPLIGIWALHQKVRNLVGQAR